MTRCKYVPVREKPISDLEVPHTSLLYLCSSQESIDNRVVDIACLDRSHLHKCPPLLTLPLSSRV
ncbi:hypothetical protein J6590_100760 [Homalodisca vitripennis]|nr:hypothetical protein J6590_100760 [Homalodisca vitripennis]